MTKKQLFDIYEKFKEKENVWVSLHIHIPDDSIETIINTNAKNKMEYVDKVYNDDLVHCNSEQIYIVDAEFSEYPNRNTDLDFGTILNLIRRNKVAAREGWNGKGMFIYYVPPGEYKAVTKAAMNRCANDDGNVPYRDYIAMKTVDGTVVPWLASQSDMLARDWYIV